MKYIRVLVIFTTLLTCLQLSFAQENKPKEYYVKVTYIRPNDRPARKDIDNQIDQRVKKAQKFYADNMENYGFGKKTFQLETDKDGKTVVHHIIAEKDTAYYKNKTNRVSAAVSKIKNQKHILLTFIDFEGVSVCGVAFGTRAMVDAYGYCFNWNAIAHELGHCFGLPHDWRSGHYILSYGPNQHKISHAAALWYDVHPYFNSEKKDGEKRVSTEKTTIKKITHFSYPDTHKNAYYEVEDKDGLHHAQLLTLDSKGGWQMHDGRVLKGENGIVNYVSRGNGARLTVKDIYGSGKQHWISFKDVKLDNIIDIEVENTNADDSLVGHWTFDEGDGRVAFDASHNNNYGIVSGDCSLALNHGKIGGALKVQPNKSHVNIKDAKNLINGLNAFSLCLWIKSDCIGTDKGFISPRTPNGKDEKFSFRYDKEGTIGKQQNIIKAGFTTENGTFVYESSANVQTTEWQHLAFTWQSDEQMKLYINGKLDTPSSMSDALSGTITDVDRLLIGRGVKDTQSSWQGLIDDVRLYNRKISEDEIKVLTRPTSDTDIYGVSLTASVKTSAEQIKADCITYSMTVTNSGNVDDKISFATSGNMPTDFTPFTVTLPAGTSRSYEITIPTDNIAVAGKYMLIVTTTSNSDITKSSFVKLAITTIDDK